MVQIKCLSNGLYSLKNSHIPFGMRFQPLPLRHLICTIFHHYISWYPSECNLRTKFDHSNRQNIHLQSQNRCFQKLTDFWKASVCLRGGVKCYLDKDRLNRAFLVQGVPLQPYNLETTFTSLLLIKLQPYNLTTLQPKNFTHTNLKHPN